MLAQWISLAAREQFCQARTEPLITLGSAPLGVSEFRAVVLGQLGEARLDVAIEADPPGLWHMRKPWMLMPRVLCATSTAAWARPFCSSPPAARWTRWLIYPNCASRLLSLRSIPPPSTTPRQPWRHQRSSSARPALETSAFFIRKVGTDGYRIHHQATLKKVVSDRRASLDEETEIKRRTSFTPRSPCRRPDGTPWRRDQSARSVAQWDLVCSQRRGVPQFPENRSSSERHLETHCHQVFDRLPLQAGAHRRRKQRPIRERERPMGCPARWW